MTRSRQGTGPRIREQAIGMNGVLTALVAPVLALLVR